VYALELAGEDDAFAAAEAGSAAAGVKVVAPGLAVAGHVRVEGVRRLAYTRAAVELLGRTAADVDAAATLLRAARVDRSGTVAVRARDLRGTAGVSTAEAERALGAVLVDRGFAVDLDDPDHELRVLFAREAGVGSAPGDGPDDGPGGDGVCALGWLVAESVRDYGDRRPTDRPFFQPGSMSPLDARAVANLAGAGPGATLLDPMCGTGGVLVEAGLTGARVVGTDAQWKMARGAAENLRAFLGDGGGTGDADGGAGGAASEPGTDAADGADWQVCRADATRLPFRDDAVDGVAVDLPYGRQSKVARHDLRSLVAGALAEAARVAPRAVVVADRPLRSVAADAGWRVEGVYDRPVHRSLTRHYHVVTRA
jgi:tRNA (guanine10-N2)-dimethyltransferase